MNLALPTLVILLGILPGIICFYGYFAGRFNKRTAGVYGGEELALYIIFSIPIDAFALRLLRHYGVNFNFDVTFHLLSGTLTDGAFANIVRQFQDSSGFSAATYLAVIVCSYITGALARRAVWAFRLDTFAFALRLRHDWFYILQGRIKGMPRIVLTYADILTAHPDESRLFQGVVVDFEIASSGTIGSLTLQNARRGSGRGDQFKWKEIPTSRFVIMGSQIHSINVRYVGLDVQPPKDRKKRIWRHARICWRSFWLEEP